MKSYIFFIKNITLAFLIFILVPTIVKAEMDVTKIIHLSDDARAPRDDYSLTVLVSDSDGTEVKKSIFRVMAKGNLYCLVEQMEPVRQVGRKLLMRDQDLWLYTPNTSRPTRISFEQKLTGEVANGDLMRTNFEDDYYGKLMGTEVLDKVSSYKIHLEAKRKDVTYRSIDYWVDQKKYWPIKAIFYAASGKPMKKTTYHNFKLQLGKVRFTKAVITDLLQKKRISELIYSKYKTEHLSPSLFNKETLGQ